MYKRKFTLSFTITDFHLLFIGLAVVHLIIAQTAIEISLPKNEVLRQESAVAKVPVSIKSRISKQTRTSRFDRYIKGLKDYKINDEILEKKNSLEGLADQDGEILKNLTKSQIDQILAEQDKQLSADIAKAKEIFQRNQKTYQACYEDALLKDKFLNGVSNIVVSINKGLVKDVQTNFKGDGHKNALSVLNDCLKTKSSSLNVGAIKGEHLINFNLIFKS